MKVKEINDYLLEKYPLSFADDFDNGKLGLVFGSQNNDVTKILYSLDLTLEVVEEAIDNKCELIVAHHPYFFHPISKINYDNEQGRIIKKMLEHNLNLFCMHTNFDVADGGVNDTLTKLLKLNEVKVVNDVVGKQNYLRYGKLPVSMSLDELIEYVKKNFHIDFVRYVGKTDKKIKTIGIIGGSGGSERDVTLAMINHCDCYISGEFRLSSGQLAKSYGMTLIEVPHGIEKLSLLPLQRKIEEELGISGIISKIDTDPFIAR